MYIELKFRHEHKIFINHADYLNITSRLKHIMKVDKYAYSTGEYKIRSIYFDNYMDNALKQKINGVNKREKFRIRFYNDDSSFIKLEKKSKINDLCNKQSIKIEKYEVLSLIYGEYNWLKEKEENLYLELYSKINSQLLYPKTIVDYIREPYVYEVGNVRVTIDKDIRTGIVSKDVFNKNLPTVPVNEGQMLLEIKYDEFLPEIIQDIVQIGERRCTSYSKYASCRIYG